jgi:hypothetical protein
VLAQSTLSCCYRATVHGLLRTDFYFACLVCLPPLVYWRSDVPPPPQWVYYSLAQVSYFFCIFFPEMFLSFYLFFDTPIIFFLLFLSFLFSHSHGLVYCPVNLGGCCRRYVCRSCSQDGRARHANSSGHVPPHNICRTPSLDYFLSFLIPLGMKFAHIFAGKYQGYFSLSSGAGRLLQMFTALTSYTSAVIICGVFSIMAVPLLWYFYHLADRKVQGLGDEI